MADLIRQITSHTDHYRSFNQVANSGSSGEALYSNGRYEDMKSYVSKSNEACRDCKVYLKKLQTAIKEYEIEISMTSRLLLENLKREYKPKEVKQEMAQVFGTSGTGFDTGKGTGFDTGKDTSRKIEVMTKTKQHLKEQRDIGQLIKDLKEIQKMLEELDSMIDTIDVNEKQLELLEKTVEAAKNLQEASEAEQRADELRKDREEKEKRRKEKEEQERLSEERRRKEEEKRKHQKEERKAKEAEERRKREEEEKRKKEEEKRRKIEEQERLKREREEAERRRREEEQRIIEEERKRKEEEERKLRLQREEEERERKRNDPANWAPKVFTSNEHGSDELAGTVRVRRDKVDVESFDLTEESFDIGNIFPGKYGERAVSNIVRLRSTSGMIKCQPQLHLSIPERYRDERETPSSHWTLVMYERTKNGEVKEHTPESLNLSDIEGTQFSNITVDEVDDSVFQVFARLKTETWNHNHREGTQISPDMDKRVSVRIPANAYSHGASVKTQLIPVTREDITNVRSRRVKSAGPLSNLSGSTPILHISAPPPDEDMNIELPIQGVERNDTGNDLTPSVHLMVSSRKGSWDNNTYQDVYQENDKAKFGIKDIVSQYTRMMVLRTNGRASAESLEEMAKALEKQKLETVCAFVVKQNNDTPGAISVNCLKGKHAMEAIERLEKQGFAKGPVESEEFYLAEGQVLEIRTRPNVKFDNGKPIRMVFYSNIDSAKKQDFISVIDTYVQREYSEYRGYISLHRCKGDSDGSYYVDKDDPNSLVCELPVTLPKLQREITMVEKTHFTVQSPPITEEYFEEIKQDLASKWKSLAKALKVSQSFANQAYNNHAGSEHQEADTAKDILVDWYKKCSRSADKVEPLSKGFIAIGENNLAADLLARDEALQEGKHPQSATRKKSGKNSRPGTNRSSWR